jgi:hypothetical protein
MVFLRTGQATPPPWGQTLSSAGGGFFYGSTASSGARGHQDTATPCREDDEPNDHHWNQGNEVPPRTEPPRPAEGNSRHRRFARRLTGKISRRRSHRAGGRAGGEKSQSRLHRAHRCGAAVRRQGKRNLRQIRHARCRGAKAGLVGRHPRQPRAGVRRQRHRRRAYPHPDALPHLRRQGDAEQCADADVHPGSAQPGQPVHFGGQGVCGAADRARHQAVQGGARQEESRGQVREGSDDFSRRHAPTTSGSVTGSLPAASTPTRTSRPSWCRRRKWWRT